MKSIFKYIFIFIVFIFAFNLYSQKKLPPRYSQIYFEDSLNVYWTTYPNPFSPSSISDSTKGLVCGNLTFYCNIADTVIIAFLHNGDSIVYTESVTSSYKPHFSFCYGMAGPEFEIEKLPDEFYKSKSDEPIKLMLIVNGRKKCLRNWGIWIPKDWYVWINNPITN